MRPIVTAFSITALVATLAAPAGAQTTTTQQDLKTRAADLGSALRFRQLGDTTVTQKGHVDLGVQFSSAPVETSSWNVARVVARFGINDRFDLGAWGGYNSAMSDGMAGVDFKIALLKQSATMPVSVSVRPSFSALLGRSDLWVANTGADLTVSRAFGAYAPYVGVAATSSLATEHLLHLDIDRETAGQSLGYAGLAYTWKSVVAAVEVEKATKASYAFRLGTRF